MATTFVSDGTATAEGYFRHYKLPFTGAAYGVIECPVFLATEPGIRGIKISMDAHGKLPIPQRTAGGRLQYVLPGGQVFAP